MGLFDRFKKKKKNDEEIKLDLKIEDLKSGDMLDYDLKTWIIEKVYKNRYDAIETTEWQLKSGDGETIYLELEIDDERSLSVSRDINYEEVISFEELKQTNEDIIPKYLTYKNEEYEFEDGPLVGVCNEEEFIYSEFYNNKDENLTIEQWDETDFTMSHTKEIEEYELSNLLQVKEQNK